jgi:hypothetical protein
MSAEHTHTGLLDVPTEVILEYLLPELSVNDLARLARVNKFFNDLTVRLLSDIYNADSSPTKHYGSTSPNEISHSHLPSSHLPPPHSSNDSTSECHLLNHMSGDLPKGQG